MRILHLTLIGAATAFTVIAMRTLPHAADDPVKTVKVDIANSGHRYPDFGFLPPPHQYEGRVFKLSQNYPQQEPAAMTIPEIATRDFEEVKKNWKQYMLDVRLYCFQGNVGAANVEDDWRVAHENPHWFHMPWQRFGPTGREGIHGMTKEAPVQPRQLASTRIARLDAVVPKREVRRNVRQRCVAYRFQSANGHLAAELPDVAG
jgi:hypothetical protein